MPFAIHSIEVPDGSNINYYDRIVLGSMLAVANAAGGSAGATVSTPISFPSGLPAAYFVDVQPSQACFVTITSKTNTGFNVVLTPMTTGTTLAAGTFDVVVIG
jgi:hypothetical protein